ncbi:histidine kinase [Azoarcus sp. KH32C]|uniref:histidine kinase n=1 Tax=Azoarcus sp. KH32C TaxID=748247 RepID=UPI00023868DD|nr:histidine kinase [Azoarcus sp. KH32C]BAL22647.1 nitrate/nitrite two-component sensor [Azoarcus sp. KH32C]
MNTVAERLAARTWSQRLRDGLAARAILLLLMLALTAITLISVVGIGSSVLVVESVGGSASVINAAGSLRRLAQRAGTVAVARGLNDRNGQARVEEAVATFETALAHPALVELLAREPSSIFSSIFRGVEVGWRARVRPSLLEIPSSSPGDPGAAAHYEALLAEVDTFADQINTLVAVLESDAESRIAQLRTMLAAALVTLLAVVVAALYLLRRRVFQPLTELRRCAVRIARGDFAARSEHTGPDELGQVGEAFNAMAEELSGAYRDLERRVQDKTSDLTRSNRALELLYHVISRLYYAPTSTDSYAGTLRELESTLGLQGSFVCVEPKLGGVATVLATTFGDCAERELGSAACQNCSGRESPWSYRSEGGMDVLQVPLRDAERLYGMLRLAMPKGRRLADWERTLLEAVTRHMGIALGISYQSERERLLALQEERSTIARELHDSLAQSLSFMKIQASLLSSALHGGQAADEAQSVLADLKEGISSAYRQLRELLATFRLQIEGDFSRLLGNTVSEYAARSGVPIDLEVTVGDSHLTPNQEIHVLHIIREGLSNATRHAQASRIRVMLRRLESGELRLEIEDDGIGMKPPGGGEPHHFGLTIMGERARGLGGEFEIQSRPGGGTRLVVRFSPGAIPTLFAEPVVPHLT